SWSESGFRGRPRGRGGSGLTSITTNDTPQSCISIKAGGGSGMPDVKEHKGMALFLLCLVQFMVVLDIAIVNVALPSIQDSLHFSETNLSWVINAYTLTFGGLLLLG